MSLKKICPCDIDGLGECPFSAMYSGDCEYWCGADEPADDPVIWDDDNDE